MDQRPQGGVQGGSPGPPPAWYADPSQPAARRYWDGTAWTDQVVRDGAWAAPSTSTSGFAIASLVVALVGGSVLAIILGLVAKSRIKQSNGRLQGRRLATAGIAIGCVWLALIVVVVTLGFTGAFDDDNADRYKGDEREVATTVDETQQAFDTDDGDRVCDDLLTPRFAGVFDSLDGSSCLEEFGRDDGRRQVDITVKHITISGDTATVDVREGDTAELWTLLRQEGRWRIDNIQTVD